MKKPVRLADFLTTEEIDAAWKLWCKRDRDGLFHRRMIDFLKPKMQRINTVVEAEHVGDVHFLAHTVEYAFVSGALCR